MVEVRVEFEVEFEHEHSRDAGSGGPLHRGDHRLTTDHQEALVFLLYRLHIFIFL